MKRFCGEALPVRPRIGLFQNDALGNFVVSTPLVEMLKGKYPDAELHLFAGTRTRELWEGDPRFTSAMPMFGTDPATLLRSVQAKSGPDGFDLVVNMEWHPTARLAAAMACGPETMVVGPCMGPEGRADLAVQDDEQGALLADQTWISADLAERYSILESGFIGEVFCRLAYLTGPIPKYKLLTAPVEREIPDVLIATSASLPEKLWPTEKWLEAVGQLQKLGLSVGLLGAPPAAQGKYWKGIDTESRLVTEGGVQDLRGKLTLPQVVGALHRAKRVLTLDNGILHLAAATETPTVGLFRFGFHRLWAPPVNNIAVLIPSEDGLVAEISVSEAIAGLDLG